MQQFPQGKIHQERGFIFQETRWLPYLKEDTALRGGGRGHKSLGSPSPSTGFGHHNPRAKSSPPSAFVNKALLSISICFHIMYNFFCNVTIELSSCPRVPIATQSLKYYLAFYRKTLSTLIQRAIALLIPQTCLILFFLEKESPSTA